MYEGRAKKIAEEQVAKQQEAEWAFNESLSQQQQQQQQQSPWGDLSKMSPSVSRPATPAQGPVPLPPPKPPSPVFVSVPPRTQRLLHSEAYLRYIEGLHADKPNVGDWEKNLTATPENTKTDESRMPASWLAQGAEQSHLNLFDDGSEY
ncbi:unnamed protein product [Mytilus coruscus]|uniref:Uncharacterized protein n=1 Tax=Mytilus coruscus TaxID=42192 RepID=A0A6J8E8E9_MYTCO|nr:unnamed protein product [Mytilus coruscus]